MASVGAQLGASWTVSPALLSKTQAALALEVSKLLPKRDARWHNYEEAFYELAEEFVAVQVIAFLSYLFAYLRSSLRTRACGLPRDAPGVESSGQSLRMCASAAGRPQ